MEVEIRVKTNDNGAVEEWWPLSLVATTAGVDAPALQLGKAQRELTVGIGHLGERMEDLAEWLRADSDLTRSLHQTIEEQAARIERLENIILAMVKGAETSYPNAGELHTHSYYPLNGARDLVKEIEIQQWRKEGEASEKEEARTLDMAGHLPDDWGEKDSTNTYASNITLRHCSAG